MVTLNVRAAVPEDVPQILQLITDLAIYEKAPDAVSATEADLHRSLFDDSPKVFALICERAGARADPHADSRAEAPATLGFAMYFFNYSTWLGKHGVYLEDLYVRPEARGLGAGKALLKAVAQVALDRDCGRCEWNVLRWNTPSIAFYEACGAKPLDEWVGYRMDRAAIERFVGSAG